VPLQAGYFISVRIRIFMKFVSGRSSNQIHRHALHRSHVIMQNGLLTAIVPFDGYARPIRFSDSAKVSRSEPPANAVIDPEKPRLIASHSNTIYSDRAHVSASDGEIVRFGR
jgi:hypothetical protein